MTINDPQEQANSTENETETKTPTTPPDSAAPGSEDASQSGKRILIGSQRDSAASLKRQTRDWTPVVEPDEQAKAEQAKAEPAESPQAAAPVSESPASPPPVAQAMQSDALPESVDAEAATALHEATPSAPAGPVPKPSVRDKLSADMEDELNQAMGDLALDTLMAGDEAVSGQMILEEEMELKGRVVTVQRGDVFVELGSREQGVLPVKQFPEPPAVGTVLDVIVRRFNAEEGLYDLAIPNAAMDVDDWSDVKDGMIVEARITGHNTGGLECAVGHLRGFIPVSQISLFRVEDLAQFVDEKFTCLITEANPERRNLVLSRRAVLEREKEEAREKMLASIEPGQIHEGVVRKLMDFGAFIDIGGIDGLLHISQLAWHRVEHPSEVLSEGQTIKVKIEKIDKDTGKMSFGYREMLQSPWDGADKRYPINGLVEGTVTKLMEFGAFVELERGVEGLVHISELSHKRIWRSSDAVQEGDKIEVMVLSVDTEAQRISLSLRQATAAPEPVKKEGDGEPAPLEETKKKRTHRDPGTLNGGVGRATGGEKFGLKW